MKQAYVIGAGLAGSEAAWQLAERDIKVTLYEMKPVKHSAAHHEDTFAELVCSNSLRSNALTNAVGVLKEEMRTIGSLIMAKADENQVPAGSALAVDRERFSQAVTDAINSHPNITVVHEEVDHIPNEPCVIATGPLSSQAMVDAIGSLIDQKYCYFYDAAAPIVTADSIDYSKAYFKSRYDKGSADYLNCPMTLDEFNAFYEAVITAKTADLHSFEKEVYFEGCMPFEVMAKRGRDTLLFGPMKPVGLEKDGVRPYAVVQLRRDNAESSLYNIVGFQTHLTWGEQKRIIHMIPGLENAEIVRYGVMHRNTYIDSPVILNEGYQYKNRKDLFFAGQMTGVEGYIESAASGMLAGINLAHVLHEEPLAPADRDTMIGAMSYYVSHADPAHFQPMNANFGIMHLSANVKKKDRKAAYAPQSLALIRQMKESHVL
ncbi:MAG: methylenetetrahydrofolate--tRNA-(uracil(54)-C(5))-methyltransferase (FADH(2)-oxidizing) TrmFO [Erysipelotrichaceae bacterium]|jgi:methylenetetrahydrofolate--tRNA-(uracil-5-)-methyltransferase|uniref:methylenetetrahydrofolate--tRNA-(uracil(54)- C(5))-methyltransferase (FADH(2)-oxidizing) TrmFO n=1 Tax=Lactimicrobium massiliense TaxID=2161814 RepID=UPI000D553F26|nr:methylenetetrahydrofolate--tRNA-(uracil(54)-C(5))-methyltransferase (FADH(2)-oxidizing) TrmFO [Lactimicrobium massiliense]MCH4020202.1 methylenetetrahydrofolate--tRNA-(uracil(54)-C(5))-methyltransferase (FADH(2)-oxidizing) TrmFO [Erysipelotrichaceae bacterium]MCI1325640.1 methylenetetrahydrofolate--tRNA-(uracil(54)-C(5))-methyltransferase (FADH(2)-oxidizing) TrmFO [Solobacterium sp.]MCH4044803.1 methylenetetrahydrofolate--tRNA-(uracil(54)-C(5))-methyltransferase (FADH(2)-oxidizing) TrmFO [Ery